jgi:broad specificity phosphatase PhoE
MSEFYIARHGQSTWNLHNRIQGQTNTQLSPLGLRQSQELFLVLKDQPLTDIYTSNLDRTIQTAQPLAQYLDIPIQSTALLNELAFGELVGKYRLALNIEDQEVWDWWMEDPIQRRIPGGESYQDLLGRVQEFLASLSLKESEKTILIVGHLRVNQVLLGCITDSPLRESLSIRQPNNWLYHFRSGSPIRGTEIPSLADGQLHWRVGLLN